MKARSERRFQRPIHEGNVIFGSGDFLRVSEGSKSHGWHNVSSCTCVRYIVLVGSFVGRKNI